MRVYQLNKACILASAFLIGNAVANAQTLELISRQDIADGGAQGNFGSFISAISADGRYVAFQSGATNLIPGGGADLNGFVSDVFVFDRDTKSLELISRQDIADGGAQGNGNSSQPAISANGRYVVFVSSATRQGAPH